MKQMQYLPEKTYNSAVLSLLCILPLQYVIHRNMLNLFDRWITSEGSEKDIAVPQLATKLVTELSWFNLGCSESSASDKVFPIYTFTSMSVTSPFILGPRYRLSTRR